MKNPPFDSLVWSLFGLTIVRTSFRKFEFYSNLTQVWLFTSMDTNTESVEKREKGCGVGKNERGPAMLPRKRRKGKVEKTENEGQG